MGRIKAYYETARERTRRRKSPWNWMLLLLSIIGIGGSYFLMSNGLSQFQQRLIPADAFLSSSMPAAGLLMRVLPFFLSIPLGFLFANLLTWCIPSARRDFDEEARGIKGASFKESTRLMLKTTLILLVVITPWIFLAISNYFFVAPDGISFSRFFSLQKKSYKWSDIVRVHGEALIERDNFHRNYILYMRDGTKIDLCLNQPLKFIESYDKIKPYIKAQPQIVYDNKMGDREVERLRREGASGEKFIRIIRNTQYF